MQNEAEAGETSSTGLGLTVMLKEEGVPGHPLAVGVTETVAVTGNNVLLVAVNEGMFPVPLEARPIDASELIQSNVVPCVMLVKFDAAIAAPLQTTVSDGTITFGPGLILIVNETGIPKHPFAAGVTVISAVTGRLVLLVAINEGILPVPLAARPIEGSEFVQVNVVPGVVLIKSATVTVVELQVVIVAGNTTTGVGFTVIVYETGIP